MCTVLFHCDAVPALLLFSLNQGARSERPSAALITSRLRHIMQNWEQESFDNARLRASMYAQEDNGGLGSAHAQVVGMSPQPLGVSFE